ncbi:type II toxin-antitoxin system VapC family toxin [Streptomyces sp. DSM 116496]|uniref:type II toxin-antitoxin system VapC family toxin n=1 Tax=Streptomyces stoeckheimensis TaxID=3344656 RepID=UPI0038B3033B
MARRVVPRPEPLSVSATLILDAQPLSLLAEKDPRTTVLIEVARRDGYAPAISAATLVEVRRHGQAGQRLAWLRSRLTVIPVTEQIADKAAELLEAAGLDGHECVVDALVVATAALSTGPAKVASSDGSHVPKLCTAASLGRPSPVQWVRV